MSLNEQNLIPLNQRTKEEVRAIASNGGKKSGASRRRKRDMKEQTRMFLDMTAHDKMKSTLEGLGVNGKDQTYMTAIIARMVVDAVNGDIKAAEFVRDTAGYKPEPSNAAINVKLNGDITNRQIDFTNITDEELRALAALGGDGNEETS